MKCSKCGKEMRKGYLFSSRMELSALQMKCREFLRIWILLKKVNPTYTASFKER